tara:strand:- start:93 stop:680 length:588 start_codon:yes stop_codon:yes gene_type:complete
MTQNSTQVAYGFGQFGSAFADASANTITAPEGRCIIAVQFLADTELSALVSKDTAKYISIGASANSTGAYTRTVDGTVSSAAKVIFDQENLVSQADQIEVGDEIYLTSDGASLGVVKTLDPDGDNTKEIELAANTSISDGVTVSFLKPNKVGHAGVGGMAIDSSNTFPKGSTIFGRWDSVSLNDNDGIIIAYFGE